MTVNILLIGYVINFIFMIGVIFFDRREPAVSMAWVMCFLMLPFLGVLLFLIFGYGLKKHTKKHYVQKMELNNNILKTFLKPAGDDILPTPELRRHANLYKYLLNDAHSICTYDNKVQIITDGNEKFKSLLHDIENAKDSINLLYFIIHNDEIGKRVLDALTRKANEGVEVRLLYDGFGSILTPRRSFRKLGKCPDGHVAEFFPVRLFSFSKLNHRNHRKIAVIDGKIAYLGGMNIGDEYLSRKKLVWRDTHMRITGSAVNEIQKYFALDWEFSTNERLTNRLSKFFPMQTPASGADIPIQIAACGPDSPAEEVKCGMIQMLYSAVKYAYIQTPYFVPDQAFLTAVTTAAESGVDVRVMIPGTPDKLYVYYTTLSYIGALLEAGAKVYLYPGFIHSKSIVVDDEVSTIGTTNIDIRSFQLHFELNAFMYGKKVCGKCRDIFLADQEKCKALTLDEYNRRGLRTVMCEGFFRLFSPIM